ncbi:MULTISPECIES: phycobilisome linker polypeptide [unclassified Roseofilum]|uniref:phycobilisome linker polypeptide n=1 Tax=unclassified Roseofilum TaxID=2620099 RepID=UPI000E9A56F9|nr:MULTISPECIES: phycobilisome linker polypeptide [unclassified Roseofilum]HBQ98681.1 hypothetical protein [Cyanobacteria bacterium UBA11691]MBP0009059.1 hypothetical protein [Roseofilum sp. Belize Diploria]MBP0014544.1 hypothetical protein [Roseofilum sp. SID3]MBP0026103.1 hypothetical protein [Roseofilum sp. SID2]MBP0033552.1 hypothetical protein [Roseofilum sp. Belize BBD 4]
MGLEGKALHEPMVRLQIEGGNSPHQRRVRSGLTVRQSQLSQAIQRIHRSGGKILEVQRVTQKLEKAETTTEHQAISQSFESVRTEVSQNPEPVEVELDPPIAQTFNPQARAVTEPKPFSPVYYSLFPQRKVDWSRIPPVRRQRMKPSLKRKQLYRTLSPGKQRRRFFRCQPLKRRR